MTLTILTFSVISSSIIFSLQIIICKVYLSQIFISNKNSLSLVIYMYSVLSNETGCISNYRLKRIHFRSIFHVHINVKNKTSIQTLILVCIIAF